MADCILCGVGGQGTVLAGKLIATAALLSGKSVRGAETIGMAQRGGSVMSCLRIAGHSLSPLAPVGQAGLLLAFEPGEAVRCLPYLAAGGVAVVAARAVKPVTASLRGSKPYEAGQMLDYLKKKIKKLTIVDTDTLAERCGSTKVVNVLLLGAAAQSGALGLTIEELAEAIRRVVPEKFREMNLQALHLGAEACR